MTQNNINALLALGVTVVIAAAMFLLGHNTVTPQAQPLGGSAYEALPKWFGGGLSAGSSQQLGVDGSGVLTLGASGSAETQLNGGFCDLNFGTVPSAIAASSTAIVDCQATNMLASATAVQAVIPGLAAWSATSGQRVRVQLASSTPALGMGVWIDGCSASTTAGYATCRLTNGTGATFTPATTTTRQAQYWIDK